MAKATVTNAKGNATPAAVKAKGAGNLPAEPKASKALVIPKIASKALSLDAGPAFVRSLAKSTQDIEQGTALKAAGENQKAAAISNLVLSVVKAAKADPSIDLTKRGSDDPKAIEFLNLQVQLATGIRTVEMVPDKKTGEDRPVVRWAPSVADHFPDTSKHSADSPEGIARNTFRSNFLHSLKQALYGALVIYSKSMKASLEKNGLLRIEGPEVKKIFGEASVVLDERQNIDKLNKKGEVVGKTELKVKPSFATMATKGAESVGKTVQRGNTSRSRLSMMTADKAIVEGCNILVNALASFKGTVTDDMRKAMTACHSALDKLI